MEGEKLSLKQMKIELAALLRTGLLPALGAASRWLALSRLRSEQPNTLGAASVLPPGHFWERAATWDSGERWREQDRPPLAQRVSSCSPHTPALCWEPVGPSTLHIASVPNSATVFILLRSTKSSFATISSAPLQSVSQRPKPPRRRPQRRGVRYVKVLLRFGMRGRHQCDLSFFPLSLTAFLRPAGYSSGSQRTPHPRRPRGRHCAYGRVPPGGAAAPAMRRLRAPLPPTPTFGAGTNFVSAEDSAPSVAGQCVLSAEQRPAGGWGEARGALCLMAVCWTALLLGLWTVKEKRALQNRYTASALRINTD